MSVQFQLPHMVAEREPASARRLPSFVGPKTPYPIAHGERWQRDALIGLSLDAQVDRIESVDNVTMPRGVLFQVGVTHRNGGVIIMRFVADETSRKWSQPIPGVIVMSRESILRSPGLEARRAVWASRDAVVSATNRYRVAAALEAAPAGLPLREVIRLVEGHARDVVHTVCALACEDIIVIDVTKGLTPQSCVKSAR